MRNIVLALLSLGAVVVVVPSELPRRLRVAVGAIGFLAIIILIPDIYLALVRTIDQIPIGTIRNSPRSWRDLFSSEGFGFLFGASAFLIVGGMLLTLGILGADLPENIGSGNNNLILVASIFVLFVGFGILVLFYAG